MATSVQQPIGVSYPITYGPQGYFNQSWTTVDAIRNQILTLLSTRKGERRMNLDFGSTLWELVFEFNGDDLTQILETAIRNDVKKWLPYVTVTSIKVDNSSNLRDQYRVNISVSFIAPTAGINLPQTVDFTIQQGNI